MSNKPFMSNAFFLGARPDMKNRSKRVGILWGGGLGDLLVIRPFLKALQANPETKSYLFTTATHLTNIFDEMCAPTPVIQLSRQPATLWPVLKKWRRALDLIYLGPHPTPKTRLLAHLMAPGTIWARRHRQAPAYLLEQVFADIKALGLDEIASFNNPAALLPWPVTSCENSHAGKPYLILHPGAKDRWQTTRWSMPNWEELIRQILHQTQLSLCIVGTSGEEAQISSLTNRLDNSLHARIRLCFSQPLKDTASLISSSSGVICHNSGILHLSTLLHKQTICITGSSAKFWRPPYPWVENATSNSCTRACNR
ncbi:MAG: glycosyltransferase family 9 protein, partial [bacterium]|nr:glycosyltransferase family 9 protein [bacterium]